MTKEQISRLHNCHINGWKSKKIAEFLGVTESNALAQMNLLLNLKYGSNNADILR